ncbi:MAG: VOC family protein [Nitrosomonadales bacterium]|jgi:glyoxylase I family protein|nr:VOC family protein [Nitrosomonadales bacterium]MBL0039139.1 VOC family protein [Nitrosomonadales bacterium]
MHITRLLHATFLVEDLDRARIFYENVLGLVPDGMRPEMSFPGVWYNVGIHQQIHLMQLPNPEANLQRPAHGGRDRHIALAVNDLSTLIQKLDSATVSYTVSMSGRPALFCRDPDDNALEFIEDPTSL